MTELNPRLGAPFTAKSGQANPDDVLRKIMEEMPDASEAETWSDFKDEILRDEDMVLACLRWYHVWARRRLENLTNKPKRKTRRTRRAENKKRAKGTVKKTKRVIILDYIMPSGKLLRDCTFREVGKLGTQFSKIAAAGKPHQIVGEVLSAKQAAALMR